MSISLSFLLSTLHSKEIFFRLENDEEGFYLSIIDRGKYPRIWADNDKSGHMEIITESVDNLIAKTVVGEKDWTARLFGTTIEELMEAFDKWHKENKLPRLK